MSSQFEFLFFIIITIWVFEFHHNSSLSFFVTFWSLLSLLSQSEFCHIWVFSHSLSFVTTWVLSQLEFCHNLSFVTIWVLLQFEFCHNLSFVNSVLSHCEFEFVTIWVFEFWHHLSFWVLSQFEFLGFITIWVFELHHNLSWVLSQFGFLSLIRIWVLSFFVKIFVWKKEIKNKKKI